MRRTLLVLGVVSLLVQFPVPAFGVDDGETETSFTLGSGALPTICYLKASHPTHQIAANQDDFIYARTDVRCTKADGVTPKAAKKLVVYSQLWRAFPGADWTITAVGTEGKLTCYNTDKCIAVEKYDVSDDPAHTWQWDNQGAVTATSKEGDTEMGVDWSDYSLCWPVAGGAYTTKGDCTV
jgi:hypothetical protein